MVAAGDTPRRMHDDDVAGGVALGIERFLHDERTVVPALLQHGARTAAGEFQIERSAPGGCRRRRVTTVNRRAIRNRFDFHPVIPAAGIAHGRRAGAAYETTPPVTPQAGRAPCRAPCRPPFPAR